MIFSRLKIFQELFNKSLKSYQVISIRNLASNQKPIDIPKKSYEIIIIGGGSGGLAVAARFARYFRAMKKPSRSIAVIEPRDVHYYQPLWTLVGAGLEDLQSSARLMSQVMPDGVDWIKESCAQINPQNNNITLLGASGNVNYKYLVVAAGINIDWAKIDGLVQALDQPNSGVCSNYSDKTVLRTWQILQNFQGGQAIFTFPNTPIKCAGAPQKIMYLSDAYLTKKGVRPKTTISYYTSLPAIFGVKHYSKVLMELCKRRQLNVNLRHNLVCVDGNKKIAYFQHLDKPEQGLIEVRYDMLHVTPPMSAPKFVQSLANESSNGFVAVDPKTLQHVTYQNVFALGDCSSLPTSKTAAAIASQNYILTRNLLHLIQNNDTDKDEEKFSTPHKVEFQYQYDGYTSCPIVTGFNRCIMAEFNYQLELMETFPFDQSKESRMMYYVKKELLPFLYWNGLIKGYWSGPSIFRKIIHLGLK